MLNIVKKTLLAGAGLTLLTADKLREVLDELIAKGRVTEGEARQALAEFREKSEEAAQALDEKKNRLVNDAYAFWLYGVLSDEIEERVETVASRTLRQWGVPQREEIDDLRRRIEALEKAAGQPSGESPSANGPTIPPP
jgi:polyhydroxyalkanoate synthesis regulator phasin